MSKNVLRVYNAVCMCSGRSTRSNKRNTVIINYLFSYATLGHLADSVKPGGKLLNTIAEIGIYVINGKKARGATRRVIPLHITTLMQRNDIKATAVTHVFKKTENNLDHQQLVLFPVLQRMVRNGEEIGHYFLIVLNLRNSRFEILNSMRSMQDKSLESCCITIVSAIKRLWGMHYADSRKAIGDYQLLKLKSKNRKTSMPPHSSALFPFFLQPFFLILFLRACSHDCGFHMLMHIQHWDGRSVCNLDEKNICIIRKILTHTWLNFEENDTEWQNILYP
ncbi:hypothetical protein C2845_PM15G17040 [Panicum miliaceum]|uniref:Uncharacterized protein n=1 Tax=Panicum miliaceum TaxID=4540 RepID=A0A3L6Q9W3_PANMI|nr:hypothetical protein C2845_PM15G17040 [Panicum miliaceum]